MRTAYRDEGDDDRFAYAVAMPALGRPAETGEPTRFIKYVINHVDARNERSYSQGMDAKRMKLIRGKLELTQEGMGNLLGVSFVSVNRWEGEHSAPLGATRDLYSALDAALRSGVSAKTILDAQQGERGEFLLKLFQLAYGTKRGSERT